MTTVRRICNARLVAVAISMIASAASAGAQTTGATLAGRVVDQTNLPLPGATVTATAPATGYSRSVPTAADGTYTIPSLPVGVYDISATLNGFRTVEQKQVEVDVSSTRRIDFTLPVASVQAEVTVTGVPPIVQTDVAVGTVVSQHELENLPLNGRQFANLGALAPGTSLGYNSDPTKPGQLVIALNGGSGRNVNFIVDGGDNTDDTIGGALQNFSVENVEQFKIQTQNYKAEYGRSSGGVVTVVTKSGTNRFDGTAFAFGRNENLNAITKTEELSGGVKNDYARAQFGGAGGGPIVRDKVHFFGSYEGTRRNTNYTVTTGGVLPEDGTVVPVPFRDHLVGAKVTSNLSPTQLLSVRFGFQKNSDKDGATPLAAPSALGTIANKYYSILASHSAQLKSSMFNELVFQYTNFKNSILADSTLPAIAYPSGAVSGQDINTPQTTDQVKFMFKDDLTFSRTLMGSAHDFKVGTLIVHEPTLGGTFSTGVDAPQFTMLLDSPSSPVTDITQFGGSFADSTPVNQYSFFAQDDWRPMARLTINLGLRYDLWTGFDLDQRTNPIWQELSTQTRYNEPYLQDFQGGKGGVLENDKNNIAPRIGATLDLRGDGRTTIRGGWGIFYDFPYTNATILFPAAAVQSNYGVAYNVNNPNGIRNTDGTFYRVGQPLPPNALPGLESDPPNEVASPTLRTPYARQFSGGFSHQLTDNLAVGVDVSKVSYRDIPFRFRANPNTGFDQPRRFPDFGNFRLWYGEGFADYKGANFNVRARLTNRFTLQGFYTLSDTTGITLAGADEFRLTAVEYQPDLAIGRDVSVNPLNPLCAACDGPLNTDARHRMALAGTYTFPRSLLVAGTLRARSATPYTIHAGVDLNGDGFRIDLPSDVPHVGDGRGSAFSQFDVRVSKTFNFTDRNGVEAIFEVFNLFNASNPAGYNGNRASATFGQPSSYAGDPLQGEQRLAQLGVRFRF
ncbi:MAG TPA: TonB-dependent receptor [Vicinamibacterales bacterium]|jgi:hypothetical protein